MYHCLLLMRLMSDRPALALHSTPEHSYLAGITDPHIIKLSSKVVFVFFVSCDFFFTSHLNKLL